ncbi:MAG: FkbM family methyltransferase [Polyangia bacterium]
MKEGQERWYAELIPLREQLVADVGANRGELSQFFFEQGAGTSEVLSIEPLAENVAAIAQRIGRLEAARWRTAAVAVSDHDGELVLAVAREGESGWNSVVRRDGREDGATRRVPCRRLSQLVPDATVVKLDVEGHEYVILEEALPRLTRVHSWALELHSVPDRPLQQTLRRFVEHGFSLVAAGRRASDPAGPWQSIPIGPDLSWQQIPVARRLADGSAFRMLHVVARRPPAGC